MGQKVNPIGFRLGVNRDWRSRWYASPQDLPGFLHSDLEIRNYVKKKRPLNRPRQRSRRRRCQFLSKFKEESPCH